MAGTGMQSRGPAGLSAGEAGLSMRARSGGARTVPGSLEVRVDKFVFRIATDRLYTADGMWARLEGPRVRVGLSDFLQRRSGDIAFVEVKPADTRVEAGEEVAAIETVKVNVSLGSPVAGRIAEVNPVLPDSPEAVNADPYGSGWLALIEPRDWPGDERRLLGPEAYRDLVRRQAGEEGGGT